jgi:hypothetical protein
LSSVLDICVHLVMGAAFAAIVLYAKRLPYPDGLKLA